MNWYKISQENVWDSTKEYDYIENNPNYPIGTIVRLNTKDNGYGDLILTGRTKQKKNSKKLLVQCTFIDKKPNPYLKGEHVKHFIWIPSEYISFTPIEKKANKEKIIWILRSPSGAGKSFLAKELGKGGQVFSTDDFFIKDGKYVFDQRLLGQAHQWNKDRAEKAMQQEISPIIIDNTNVKFSDFANYLLLAKKYNYIVKYAEPSWHPNLKTPEGKWNIDFILQQQKNKDRSDIGKTIPEDVIKRMVNHFQYKLPNETDEEFTQRILGK